MKTDYLPLIFKESIGERKEYFEEISTKNITRFFKPGNRADQNTEHYVRRIEGYSFIMIFDEIGNHKTKTLPKVKCLFLIKIIDRKCIKIKDIDNEEIFFKNSYSCIKNKIELIQYLKKIYNDDEFTEESEITFIDVEFC